MTALTVQQHRSETYLRDGAAALPALVFQLEAQRYAVALDAVERVVRAVALTPVPEAPRIVLGVIDVAGRVVPVLSLRRHFGLPDKPISPEDYFVLVRTATRVVALVMDEALEVIQAPIGATISADGILPTLTHIHGAIRLDDGLVLIHDLTTCLSLDDERQLTGVLGSDGARQS